MPFITSITRTDVWMLLFFVASFILILRIKTFPSSIAIQDFATMLNTKGGIILTLGFLSLVFFFVTIIMFYTTIQDLKAGTLKVDNAIALMGLQFCMNSAFSLCLGACLKTMSGEVPIDKENTTSVETTTKTIKPRIADTDPTVSSDDAATPTPTVVADAVKTVAAANKTVADVTAVKPLVQVPKGVPTPTIQVVELIPKAK